MEEDNEEFRMNLEGKQRDLELMGETIKREYADFSRNRSRLKTEYNMATNKTHDQFAGIEDLLNSVAHQNDYNTLAIKKMLDAQMIDQLIQRQDVEDRKRLLMLGVDKPQAVWQRGKEPP